MAPFTIRSRLYPPGLRQRRHSHDHNNVTIVTGGWIEESSEAGEYRGGASSVVLKAAGCEHETRIGGLGARTLTIEFGASSSLAQSIAPRTWWWTEEITIVRRALAVQRALSRLPAGAVERMAIDLVSQVISSNEISRGVAPAWIATVTSRLERDFENPPPFEELAREIGLHPVYMSRAFRRHVGSSMTDYVRALRLRRARHLLASTRHTIAAIAGESGFADSSHLARTFTQLLDMTPTAYRRLCVRP